jgi:hypothetical protein
MHHLRIANRVVVYFAITLWMSIAVAAFYGR